MKLKSLVAIAALCLSTSAYADGSQNVVVTKVKTLPITGGNCLQIQTNGGPSWYAVVLELTTKDADGNVTTVPVPTASDTRTQIWNSRIFKFPISFNLTAPSVDCPNGQNAIQVTQ